MSLVRSLCGSKTEFLRHGEEDEMFRTKKQERGVGRWLIREMACCTNTGNRIWMPRTHLEAWWMWKLANSASPREVEMRNCWDN